jgi:Protein of unknown function (DUF1501)
MSNQLLDRRDILKWGGTALAAACAGEVIAPPKVKAAGKSKPRGTARNCVIIMMGGAISHADCWDFKETRHTPKDLDIQKFTSDIYLSKTLFPRASEYVDKIALVRSMRANELIHFIGQYHTQTGRALNVAVAREIPALGSVVAHELEGRRRESDTFPTYVSMYMAQSSNGAIGCGFLPTRATGLDLDPTTVCDSFGKSSAGSSEALERRWQLLQRFEKVAGADRSAMGKKADDYKTFYADAQRVASDPRWSALFKITPEEQERYGKDEYGMGLILSRNILCADAGTHFIYINDGSRWDQHSYIFDRSRRINHYVNCERFDKGFASFVKDLSSMPGSAAGKTLLDETMIIATSEFGRTPAMNAVAGRDHYRQAYTTLFAGGGVKGGGVIGKTNDDASAVVDNGWKHRVQPFMDNCVATIFSALGIDWMKTIENTPSGRSYEFVQTAPIGGGEFISTDEIATLFE